LDGGMQVIYECVLQKLAFPISNLVMRRKFWAIHNELQFSQWFSGRRTEEVQLAKLKILLEHAYGTVPLYRKLMDKERVRPSDIKRLEDIRRLPIVTKKDFREGFPERCTSSVIPREEWILDSTSGSTGNSFQFIRDRAFSDYILANTYRNYTWTGMKIGNKTVSLWGYHKRPAAAKVLDWMMRRRWLSSFDVESNYREYYQQIKKYRPYLIEAYSASVTHFAKLLRQDALTDLQIPAVISSAETLYPESRKLIEDVLQTKVFNRYGSREVGIVAHECDRHTGLHINAESHIVEIVKESRSHEMGRIIVTNLTNFAMPFIRYDTEDYGKDSSRKCPCGRNLPILESIEGRVADFIRLPNGEELSYLFFSYFFEQYGAYLRQFQVVQDENSHLTMNFVTTSAYNDEKEKGILEGIQKNVGRGMKITINKVDKIEKEKSGKTRPIKRLI
jgi:phenylacetate-CoA ligase